MICDEIPTKQDKHIESVEETTAAATEQCTMPGELTVTNETETGNNDTATAGASGRRNWVNREKMTIYFQQKNKLIREAWHSQQARLSRNRDGAQLFWIMILSAIAIAASLIALTTNNWLCESWNEPGSCFGLWNTCGFETETATTPDTTASSNETVVAMPRDIVCMRQEWGQVMPSSNVPGRVDQVMAAQGLIVAGTVVFALSLIGTGLGCKFIQMQTRLNALRNVLCMSMFVQIMAFLMHLIGMYLYILSDNISMSIGLLFVYFGIGIFASNFINFITIEYKCYKFRQMTI